MKTMFKAWWVFVLIVMTTTGVFGFLMLIAEAESWSLLLATKVIAIAAFIVTYWLYKWLYKNQF